MTQQEIILGLRAMGTDALRSRDGFEQNDTAYLFWQGRADLLFAAANTVERYRELLQVISKDSS